MKRFFFLLILVPWLIPTGLNAQVLPESLPPVQTRYDTLVIEFYFCYASAWDDTTYYSGIFGRFQDIESKKNIIKMHWRQYVSNDLQLENHTGFVMGPYYDSSYAINNRLAFFEGIPDSIPVKRVNYIPEAEIPY